ncbi:MAG: PspA/IM30 family protein [Myxococcaceae bacterium]|nr:PspA/IM30 family protein [Myxococcaceae bacterium]MBH2006738.1 PspA/IM30 family protein [Myxococcaceae bacterium]
MGLLQRFWTMLKSQLNYWIGKAEDPEKMLNQTLLDMQEQLMTAKRQVAIAIADERRLIQQYEQEKQNAEDWEQRAMLAVQQDNDGLASQALERQAEHLKLAAGFEENWRAQKQSVDQLREALSGLNQRIVDAKRQKNLLIARARRAEAQRTITETMTGLGRNSALDTMARMEEKINQMEAEAEATSELAGEIGHDPLLNEFKKLEPVKTSNALLQLKAKMGILSATPEIKQLERAEVRDK